MVFTSERETGLCTSLASLVAVSSSTERMISRRLAVSSGNPFTSTLMLSPK